jgi:hypothetical protein
MCVSLLVRRYSEILNAKCKLGQFTCLRRIELQRDILLETGQFSLLDSCTDCEFRPLQ